MLIDFLKPWEFSPTVIVVLLAAALSYLRQTRRSFYFWLGLTLFYIALQTKFDYYSEHEFLMHRIQHSILHHIAPFLIALGRPRIPRLKFLDHPVIAPAIFCALILLWLIPQIHFVAMLDWRLYRVMNWSMAINGVMFWNLALNSRLPAVRRILMMFVIIPPQIMTGMVLSFTGHELYPGYSLCGRAFAISALQDQQIGGLILWVPAAMMGVIGILIVVKREWLQHEVS